MGIFAHFLFGQTNGGQNGFHLLCKLVALDQLMLFQRLCNDIFNGHARIERAIRILKDDLHVLALLPERLAIHPADIPAFEKNFSVGGLCQAQNALANRRFSAAGFTHKAKGFTLVDLKAYSIDSLIVSYGFLEQSLLDGKIFFQSTNRKQRLCHACSSSLPRSAR